MRQPNILFIVMDTARAKNSLPSTNKEIVPNLAGLAEGGVEFTSAISNAPWTLPSHASMLSGQYTSDHGTNAGNKKLDSQIPYLPELMKQAGYTTVAFSNNSWVSPAFNFDRGFDYFYKSWEILSAGENLAQAMREESTPKEQVRYLIKSTDIKSIPPSVINTLYAKFIRKKYDYGAYVTNWRIKRWFEKEYSSAKPFFTFINYIEPHLEYDPPKDYCDFLPEDVSVSEAKKVEQDAWGYISGDVDMSERDFEILEGLYNSEIHYLDHRIGNLMNYLSAQDILDETIVIIIGDHGENIGDHGFMDHQYCLYDTLVHVPLIIKGPHEFSGGETVTQPVESRDIFPTILEATGIKVPEEASISKDSLYDTLGRRDATESAAIAEYLVPQPTVDTLAERAPDPTIVNKYNRALRAVRTIDWKYIKGSDGSSELYHIKSDPEERSNVADANPDIVKRFETKLEDKLKPFEQGNTDNTDSGQVDAGAQQRLEDLGYL